MLWILSNEIFEDGTDSKCEGGTDVNITFQDIENKNRIIDGMKKTLKVQSAEIEALKAENQQLKILLRGAEIPFKDSDYDIRL